MINWEKEKNKVLENIKNDPDKDQWGKNLIPYAMTITDVKAEIVSAKFYEKANKFSFEPNPSLKSWYHVTFLVDGKEAYLQLANEAWPREDK